MPLPSTVLIDTNIIEQHAYHFASPQIAKFVLLAQVRKLTLLLPDAIQREVKRHIKYKSHEAQSALKKACREAPFLPKWAHWPEAGKAKAAENEIEAAVTAEWDQFLKSFKVERLGYGGIDMNQVMDWYDQQQAPFGEGAKRKEFPDAFTLASAVTYASAKSTKVAVVSADSDIKKFCDTHPELLHFSDLPTLTEAFIAETKTQVAALKEAFATQSDHVLVRIREDFPELAFYPEEDPNGDVSGVEVDSVELTAARFIAIEDQYCTIAFDADVQFSAYVSYGDPDTMIINTAEDIRMPLLTRAGTVSETANISGTITLQFDGDWKTIVSAFDLEFDRQDISVHKRPGISHDDEECPPEGIDES
jgi:hypothetical protein